MCNVTMSGRGGCRWWMEMNKSDTPHWAAMSTPRCGLIPSSALHTLIPQGAKSMVTLRSKRKKFGYMYVFSYYYQSFHKETDPPPETPMWGGCWCSEMVDCARRWLMSVNNFPDNTARCYLPPHLWPASVWQCDMTQVSQLRSHPDTVSRRVMVNTIAISDAWAQIRWNALSKWVFLRH